MDEEPTLKSLVRSGALDFEALARLLSSGECIVDGIPDEHGSIGRVAIHSARQEDFDALFEFFFPGKTHDVELMKIATDKGYPDNFLYMLFNSKAVDYERAMKILVQKNQEQFRKDRAEGIA